MSKPITKNKTILTAMEILELIAYIILGLIMLPIALILGFASNVYNTFKKLINNV